MEMTSLSIDLPEPLKVFVEIEAQESGYATASDYVRALIRDAERRKSDEAVESLLFEGLKPHDRGTMNDAEWESYQQRHRAGRLDQLRQEIAASLDEAARGKEYSAEEVFQRLEARNREALNRP